MKTQLLISNRYTTDCCYAPPLCSFIPLHCPPVRPPQMWPQWRRSTLHLSSPLQRHRATPMSGVLIHGALLACCAPLRCSSLLRQTRGAPMTIPGAPWVRSLVTPIPGAPWVKRLAHVTCLSRLALWVCPCIAFPGTPYPPATQPPPTQVPVDCPPLTQVLGNRLPNSPVPLG